MFSSVMKGASIFCRTPTPSSSEAMRVLSVSLMGSNLFFGFQLALAPPPLHLYFPSPISALWASRSSVRYKNNSLAEVTSPAAQLGKVRLLIMGILRYLVVLLF